MYYIHQILLRDQQQCNYVTVALRLTLSNLATLNGRVCDFTLNLFYICCVSGSRENMACRHFLFTFSPLLLFQEVDLFQRAFDGLIAYVQNPENALSIQAELLEAGVC